MQIDEEATSAIQHLWWRVNGVVMAYCDLLQLRYYGKHLFTTQNEHQAPYSLPILSAAVSAIRYATACVWALYNPCQPAHQHFG